MVILSPSPVVILSNAKDLVLSTPKDRLRINSVKDLVFRLKAYPGSLQSLYSSIMTGKFKTDPAWVRHSGQAKRDPESRPT